MRKIKYKSIVIILILISIIIFFGYKNFYKLDKSVHIFEIPNTKEIYANNNYGEPILYVDEYYMITNPPEELDNLKILIEKFENDNKLQEKLNAEANKYNGSENYKKRIYDVTYYSESSKFPRNWQPKKSYFLSDDTIDRHKDNVIASTRWLLPDGKKIFLIYKKSENKNNYGEVIEYKNY